MEGRSLDDVLPPLPDDTPPEARHYWLEFTLTKADVAAADRVFHSFAGMLRGRWSMILPALIGFLAGAFGLFEKVRGVIVILGVVALWMAVVFVAHQMLRRRRIDRTLLPGAVAVAASPNALGLFEAGKSRTVPWSAFAAPVVTEDFVLLPHGRSEVLILPKRGIRDPARRVAFVQAVDIWTRNAAL